MASLWSGISRACSHRAILPAVAAAKKQMPPRATPVANEGVPQTCEQRPLVRAWGWAAAHTHIRVRVEIMGSQKCRNVGNSQPVLMMINPIVSTRTRTERSPRSIRTRSTPPPRGGEGAGTAAGQHAPRHLPGRLHPQYFLTRTGVAQVNLSPYGPIPR
jgi:hypothetical protein